MSADAPATKERVFLEADDEIRGQKYVCLSFLTPNRGILRNKDLFFFHKFLEFYAMDYKVRATESFVLGELNTIQTALSDVEMTLVNTDFNDASGGAHQVAKDLAEKITLLRGSLSQKVGGDLEAHVKENLQDFKESSIVESYEKWMLVNRQRLEDEFHKLNDFQTTLHGLKVRGVYSTMEQATDRAKKLNKKDPYFNVFVGEVGEWLPWDPEPDDVADSSYQNDELNKLMQAYRENAAKKDAFFEEEKRQKLAAAAAAAVAAPGSMSAVAAARGQPAPTPLTVGPSESSDMFSDAGDLALARKAAAAESADDKISLE
jgi:hypothetical protein